MGSILLRNKVIIQSIVSLLFFVLFGLLILPFKALATGPTSTSISTQPDIANGGSVPGRTIVTYTAWDGGFELTGTNYYLKIFRRTSSDTEVKSCGTGTSCIYQTGDSYYDGMTATFVSKITLGNTTVIATGIPVSTTWGAAPTPTPTPSCSNSTGGCSSCIARTSLSCGWCFNDNSCKKGTSTQSDDGSCYGKNWTKSVCATPTPTPTPRVPTSPPIRTPTPIPTLAPGQIPACFKCGTNWNYYVYYRDNGICDDGQGALLNHSYDSCGETSNTASQCYHPECVTSATPTPTTVCKINCGPTPTPTRTPTPTITVPIPPTPTSGTASNITTNSAKVTWLGSLPTGGYYVLYYRVSPSGTWIRLATGINNYYALTSLSSGTPYQWYAQACNSANSCSTSATWSFTALPVAPTLSTPTNGANVSGTSITFKWLTSTGATQYWLEVNSDVNFGAATRKYSANVGNVLTYTVPGFLNNGTKYYWRAYSGNTAGWSTPSGAWNFINSPVVVKPLAPTLSTPTNGANVSGTSITFRWLTSTGATQYWLEVNSDVNFGAATRKYYANVGNVLTYTVPGFLNNGTKYYWRMQAGNSAGWSLWSTAWNFTNKAANISPTPTPTKIPVYGEWQSCSTATPTGYTGGSLSAGYLFAPQRNGQITHLCGVADGTKWVRLYNETYTVLASAQITSTGVKCPNANCILDWACTAIPPVNVTTGSSYYVVIDNTGSNGYTMGFDSFPKFCNSLYIMNSVYQSLPGTFNSAHRTITAVMYGIADVVFR